MAQFQLKLNKTDSMMLGMMLKEYKFKVLTTLLNSAEYENEHLYRTQNKIVNRYLENLSDELVKFGTDERFFQREKGLQVRQDNFYKRLLIKLFGNEDGYLGLTENKRLKVLQKFELQENEPNKESYGEPNMSLVIEYSKRNKQLELTEIIEEIKQEQLKP